MQLSSVVQTSGSLTSVFEESSDGVSRLGLGLETSLENRFFKSRPRRSQVSSRSLSRRISVSVSSSSSRDFA